MVHCVAGQRVGDLDQEARAVAHELVIAHGAAVVQVFQDLQALLDDGVAFAPFDMGDETHATGVVFLFGVVQALACRNADRSEEHTSELQSLMRNSYAVFCLKKKKKDRKAKTIQHSKQL